MNNEFMNIDFLLCRFIWEHIQLRSICLNVEKSMVLQYGHLDFTSILIKVPPPKLYDIKKLLNYSTMLAK
jgi:hypothetical protein